MKTLTLSLKKEWFDMIKSGEKKEEYREIKPHYARNFICDFILGKKQEIGQLSLF